MGLNSYEHWLKPISRKDLSVQIAATPASLGVIFEFSIIPSFLVLFIWNVHREKDPKMAWSVSHWIWLQSVHIVLSSDSYSSDTM